MIREYKQSDASEILNIINDASLKYKGIIPNDCWKEPYMSKQELIDGFSNGVRMYGYHQNNTLIGVIGVQEVKDVILIRHAYTLSSYQKFSFILHTKEETTLLLKKYWKISTKQIENSVVLKRC